MASRSRPEGPRPLLRAARFVARLLPRSLRPGRPGSTRSAPGPSVGAGLTDGMRVRAPWSLMRWYQALRQHPAASAPPGSAAAPGATGSRPAHAPLAIARGLPNSVAAPSSRLVGRTANGRPLAVARTPLTTHGSLIAAPPGGPDVRPGHDLAMAPGIAALRRPDPGHGMPTPSSPAAALPGATPGPAAASGATPRSGPAGGAPARSGPAARPAPVLGATARSASAVGGSARSASVLGGSARSASAVGGSARSASVLGATTWPAPAPGTLAAGAGPASSDGPVARAAGAGGPTVHGDDLPGMVGFGPGGYGFAIRSRRFIDNPPPVASSAPAAAPLRSASPTMSSRPATGGGAPGRLGPRGAHPLDRSTATASGSGVHLDRHGPGARPGEPLAGRPAAGPVVSDPDGIAGMRVLGAASLPPGSVPDPTGAVTVGPAVGHDVRPAAHPVAGRTPRERWESSVASRPLEAPRQLPAAFHAMASAITGRARPPLFTTGPNTRHALAAAGALGATTGAVVHLPAVPTTGPALSAVLAHELTHTRSPVRRPRFLLDGASALLDDDERQALTAGRNTLSGLGQSAASGLGQAAGAGAGIVDSLPVGGGGMGAVSEVATRAARAAVLEASGSPMGSAFSGMAGDAVSSVQGAAGGAMSGMQSAAAGAAGAAGDALDGAAGAVSDAAGGVSNVVGGVTSGAAGSAGGATKPLDPDQVIEIVERRLLREIERRGGRWAGMF